MKPMILNTKTGAQHGVSNWKRQLFAQSGTHLREASDEHFGKPLLESNVNTQTGAQCMCMCMRMCMGMCMCMRACVCVCARVCARVYALVHVYVYVSLSVQIYFIIFRPSVDISKKIVGLLHGNKKHNK